MGFKDYALCVLLLSFVIGSTAGVYEKRIGIDLGTTYSSVGVYKDDKVEIIVNDRGNRRTPFCVAFTDTGVLIGEAAKNQSDVNPGRTICDVRRLLGRNRFDDPEVQRDIKLSPYKIIDKNGKPYIEVKMRDGEITVFSPEEICAKVLQNMKEMAETYLGEKIDNAVIAIPTYFDGRQIKAIRDAAIMAGLHEAHLFSEAAAAAIAYDLHKECEKYTLVSNLASGTLDISILMNFHSKVFEMVGKRVDNNLGGEYFDHNIMDYFAKVIEKKYNKDINQDKEALGKLKRECEKARTALTSQEQVLVKIESLFDGIDFLETLTVAKFEELNTCLFTKIRKLVKGALLDAGLITSEIDHIVLVGGGAHIPKMRQLLKDFFDGKEPMESFDPDEVVVYGAAIQGELLASFMAQDFINIELYPVSLAIETAGGVMTKLTRDREYYMPFKRSQMFTTYLDQQTSVSIKVYEKYEYQCSNKVWQQIGRFDLSGIAPAPRGMTRIKVTFRLDGYDLLHVIAEDKVANKSETITIDNRTSLLRKQLFGDIVDYPVDDQKILQVLPGETLEEDETIYGNWNLI